MDKQDVLHIYDGILLSHKKSEIMPFHSNMGRPRDDILSEVRHRKTNIISDQIRSVAQSCPTLQPHESQHTRPPCPSPTPGVHSDSRPLSQWCHPGISSSVVPLSSCPQSLPASEYFPMSQLFTWGGQSTGVSALASFPPKKSQGWSSEWTGWISWQSKEALGSKNKVEQKQNQVNNKHHRAKRQSISWIIRTWLNSLH